MTRVQRVQRNVGPPVRLEDDEGYLNAERLRDPTKPAFPRLLARNTIAYDPTLPPILGNTRQLNQPLLEAESQIPTLAAQMPFQNIEVTSDIEDVNKEFAFEETADLDMSTSESEGESEPEMSLCEAIPKPSSWSSISHALRLTIYETLFYAEKKGLQKENSGKEIDERTIQAKIAAVLALSNLELSEIEAQRSFRAKKPVTEDNLRDLWMKDEIDSLLRDDYSGKGPSRDVHRWQDVSKSYMAQMLHISKYNYAYDREIEMAKVYLATRGLKPNVIGKWREYMEEHTMVLVSTELADSLSSLYLHVTRASPLLPLPQPLNATAVSRHDVGGEPSRESLTNEALTQLTQSEDNSLATISSFKDSIRKHGSKSPPKPRLSILEYDGPLKYTGYQKERFGKKPGQSQAVQQAIIKTMSLSSSQTMNRITSHQFAEPAESVEMHDASHGIANILHVKDHFRACQPTRSTDLSMRVSLNGLAEVHKDRIPKRVEVSEIRTSPLQEYRSVIRLVADQKGTTKVDGDARSTPEIESLVQKGIDAGNQGASTGLGGRLEGTGAVSLPGMHERLHLPVGSDHMPVSLQVTRRRVPSNNESGPPQSASSSTTNISPSHSLARCTLGVPQGADANSLLTRSASQALRSVQMQMKRQIEANSSHRYPPLPFAAAAFGLPVYPAEGNASPRTTSSSQYDHALSVPLLSPNPLIDDYDSGLGTSRATSTEQEIPKHNKKRTMQIGDRKVTQSSRKTGPGSRGGKGARGGTGVYNTKRKKAAQHVDVVARPSVEKKKARKPGSSSHAA